MIFNTFIYTIKRELRDKVSLFLMLLFPIILVLIVGTCLRSDFEAPIFNKARIAIVNLDETYDYANVLVDIFKSEKVEKFIDVDTDITTLDDAYEKYLSKDIDAYIEIPKGYAKSIMDGSSIDIVLNERGENSQEINITKQVLNEFTTRLNLLKKDRNINVDANFDADTIVVSSINKNHIPTSMDYYGVTLVILICLYGSLYIVRMISDTLLDETGMRLKTITDKEYKIECGLALGSILVVILQVLLLIAIFKMGYKVYYGEHIFKIFVLLVSLILFSNAMGVFIIKLFKNYNLSYVFLNVLILGSTFISSGFVVLDLGDGLFSKIVENFLPNAICQNTIFSVIYNTNAVDFTNSLCTILIETLVVVLLSLFINRKENVV